MTSLTGKITALVQNINLSDRGMRHIKGQCIEDSYKKDIEDYIPRHETEMKQVNFDRGGNF